jgi:putative copper resistance protein D
MSHDMEMPDMATAPTFGDLLAWQDIDPWVLGVVIALAGGYAIGVVALRRGGIAWPWLRVASWFTGVAALVAVTGTGVGTYGMALFSVHMTQHMVLGMLVPILLLAGAPVTLALRALPTSRERRGSPRRTLVRFLHSRLLGVLSHPLVTGGLFVASLYGLYFTPLLDVAMSTAWGHRAMLGHFLAVGLLFFGPILAVDPWPHRWSPGARLLQLVASVPFHAFFGVAIMGASSALSTRFASSTEALGLDPLADQSTGGGIAWAFGEIPIVIVAAVVFAQWVRSDTRDASRLDRQAERDDDSALAAYNRALAGLARRDQGPQTMQAEVATRP